MIEPSHPSNLISIRTIVLVSGLIGGVAALLSPLPEGLSEEARRAAVIGAIMALLWVTEALPLAVTAMIPLAAFPLARVAEMDNVSRAYAHPIVFLFLGGFVLAAAMQHWQLDRRLSLIGLRVAGPRPELQILSMMAATAFLSMWISNTATAMVMMPIGLAMLGTDGCANGTLSAAALKAPANEVGAAEAGTFGTAMMLGIAFAATIGGMGSLIGTPPNALFAAFVEKTYDVSIGFGQWMLLGIPIVILLLPITWMLLTRVVFHLPPRTTFAVSEREKPPAMSTGQRILAMVLALTAFAWISRPYLAAWLGLPGLSDAGIAITAALTLFVLPADKSFSRPLLTWDEVKSIRWDVLILFGGGLALADAIHATGLADWIGGGAAQLSNVPVVALILIMMVLIVYLGELASNTAMAAVFLPVAAAAAAGLGFEPLSILLPVALAASLGFMLPVATPPNAIVYGSGAVSAQDMLRAGAILDVISIVLVFILATTLGPIVFGLNGAANP